MSWLSSGFKAITDEVKRTPANLVKIARNPFGALVTGVNGLLVGKKGANRGPRFTGPVINPMLPDTCRSEKGSGVVVDHGDVIYDYKAIGAGAQTASGVDFFDDTTTNNINEAKRLPAGLYKSLAVTLECNNAADTLGMLQDAIIRLKSGKNGDIVWERRLMDVSDFVLTDTTHGVIIRQDGGHASDVDILVTDDSELNYLNLLFPSIPTFTGTVKATMALTRFE